MFYECINRVSQSYLISRIDQSSGLANHSFKLYYKYQNLSKCQHYGVKGLITNSTYLQNTGAMTVLAIGKSHAELTRFYLDKPVCIQESLYFCLIPLMGDTQVQMRCQTQPTFIRHTESDLQPPHPMQVKELYTFFYQEKEQGFMFSGENHPVTELTYVSRYSVSGEVPR